MTQDEAYEMEYKTRIIWVDTDFSKMGYTIKRDSKFNQLGFKCTREQYDKEIEQFNDHSITKIIGEHIYYSLEDWKAAHPEIKPYPHADPFDPEVIARCNESDKNFTEEIRERLRKGIKINRLEKLHIRGKI